MWIERIDIENFGKLKNFHLGINSRFNVIFGINGSGKSTLAAFIKFVFYGYKGEENSKIDLNEKKLYMSWATNKVAGSMIIHYKEKKYKIEREFQDREKTRIIDLSTNITVFAGEEPGVVFFKMDEETYSKSAFLKQFDTTETGGNRLSEMIQNILFSADEDTSTKNALAKLNNAKNELLSEDKTEGNIALLTKKVDELQISLKSSLEDQRELLNLESSIKEIEEKVMSNNEKSNELNEELENYKSYNAGQELQRIDNTRRQVATLKRAYERLLEKYSYEGFVPDNEYSKELSSLAVKIDTAKEKLNEVLKSRKKSLENYNACEEKNQSFKIIEKVGGIEIVGGVYTKHKRKEKIFVVIAIIMLVFSAISTGTLIYSIFLPTATFNIKLTITTIIAGTMLSSILFFVLRETIRKKIMDYYTSFKFESEIDFASSLDDYYDTEEQLSSLKADLDLYDGMVLTEENKFEAIYSEAKDVLFKWNKTPESDVRTGADFEKFAQIAAQVSAELDEAKTIYEQYKSKLEIILDGVDEKELRRLAAMARTPNYDEKQITKELDFLKKANESMSLKEHELARDIAVLTSKLPDPSILKSQIMMFEERIALLTEKYNAIDTAIKLIEESCIELKDSIAPRLTETATKLFSIATGGVHQDLLVDANFELDTSDGVLPRDIEYMSAGTRDVAYLCFRMALMDMLYENNLPPLICDDSFVRLDSERLDNIVKVLAAFSKKSQIFIFTCHEREAKAFSKYEANILQL